MTISEGRYEKAWNSFLIYLNHHPSAWLKPFLEEWHINHRSMNNWLWKKGYSVLKAKREAYAAQAEEIESIQSDTSITFLPLQSSFELPLFNPQDKQCKMPYNTLSAIMSGLRHGGRDIPQGAARQDEAHGQGLQEKLSMGGLLTKV